MKFLKFVLAILFCSLSVIACTSSTGNDNSTTTSTAVDSFRSLSFISKGCILVTSSSDTVASSYAITTISKEAYGDKYLGIYYRLFNSSKESIDSVDISVYVTKSDGGYISTLPNNYFLGGMGTTQSKRNISADGYYPSASSIQISYFSGCLISNFNTGKYKILFKINTIRKDSIYITVTD